MKRIFSCVLNCIRIILTGKSDTFVDEGILGFSGQGRDRYGR